MAIRSRSPVEWAWDHLKLAAGTLAGAPSEADQIAPRGRPLIRRIVLADLATALRRGFDDFTACRTDVVILCAVYPVAGLVLARLASGANLLPLVFPLVSGFALLGPLFAVGLSEMSRRREAGEAPSWAGAFAVARSPAFSKIVRLGLVLALLFVLWLVAAGLLTLVTLGPRPPASLAIFLHELFATRAGLALIILGLGVGFLFALVVLAISFVSFPLLLDRNVTLETAIATSLHAVLRNPIPAAAWGLIVAGLLVLGAIPLLIGLVVVLPVLGHATWHLYRRVIF